ncbi:MAG TPA: hypothetical protein VE131_16230, partial [Terriglobales bacterium]|nr:hypothetical protein [Terriglobales bacterium]
FRDPSHRPLKMMRQTWPMRPLSLKKIVRSILLLILLWNQGCASSELVSRQAVEDKIAKIKVGESTREEMETLLGREHGNDRDFWVYNLSDTSMDIAERRSGRLSGILPIIPVNQPTNTRALITMRFSKDGIVKRLLVERYFDAPYTNDYWYWLSESAGNVLESVSRLAAASGLQTVNPDLAKRTLLLEDGAGKARLTVTATAQILHIESMNPYDRLSKEYRIFKKEEFAFTEKIAASEMIR